MSRGVGRIVKRVYKMVGKPGKKHRRYVGIDAKGRWKFLKTPGKSKPKKAKTKTKRRKRSLAEKKRRRRQFTIPIAIVAPIAGSVFMPPGPPGWQSPFEAIKRGMYDDAFRTFVLSWTFYDPGRAGNPSEGFKLDGGVALKAMLAGAVVHFIASKLGINRYLGRARVPLIRI